MTPRSTLQVQRLPLRPHADTHRFSSRAAWRVVATTAALALTIALAGCASTPQTTYYSLASPAAPATSATQAQRKAGASPLFIEVAPVAMPDRLARPQLVVRAANASGDAQVEVLEQHRWSSSLDSEMRDALAGGIATALGAINLTRGGPVPTEPAWRIGVQVERMDAVIGRGVSLDMTWTLRRSDSKSQAVCSWRADEAANGSGVDALAQAAQRATAQAAAAIARHIAVLDASGGKGATAGCTR